MTNKIIFSSVEKDNIRKSYLVDKKTIKRIALEHGVSSTPIKSVLRGLKVATRPPQETSRKYTINENYFASIDSNNKAYCLGFLMADGYNNESRNVVQIALGVKDVEVLHFFNEELECNKPIRYVTSNGCESVRQDFCSEILSSDLKKYGCVQRKTEILTFPSIKKKLLKDFVRGYFDGDGCFYYCIANRNNGSTTIMSKVTITSSVIFLNSFKNMLMDELRITSNMSYRHSENVKIGTLTVSGNLQVIKFMEWIYEDSDAYFLSRKKCKYEEFLIKRDKRLKNRRKN